ncbi:MAG: Ig-like domain-containing protein, partial [Acidobacteriota bacterium]
MSKGVVDPSRTGGLEVPATLGDRIVLLIGAADVDPYATFSMVFNEPIDAGADPLQFFKITLDGQPITLKARVDSERRVVFESSASLQRGGKYRLEISPDLVDKAGVRIGQVRDTSGNLSAPLTEPLYLDFEVRKPGGKVGSFDLASGVIRDQALSGNLLFVSALEGGIYAYDIGNPAGLTATSPPVGHHPGGVTSYWALASDHHGRIYATGMTSLMGVVRSFRLEDFSSGNMNVQHRGAGTVSFVPGAAASLDIPSRIIASDRPEAIPRKLQVLVQDREVAYDSRQELLDAGALVTGTNGDLDVMTLEIPFTPGGYLLQRVTVENLTLDMRWSADATNLQPAKIESITGRKDDRFRVLYNEMTYGVVSLLGYGIAVIDLNAIESNDAPGKPAGYENIRELVRLTSGKVYRECGTLPQAAIPDLAFVPDAAVRTVPGSSDIQVFALDPNRGVLDLNITPPRDAAEAALPPDRVQCAERMSATGLVFRTLKDPAPPGDPYYDHPRLKKLRELYGARTGRAPFGRYNAAAPYVWTLEAQDNHVVTPATTPGTFALGQRGSLANQRVTREYILIPANEYGLLVVEIGGDTPVGGGIPGAPPFTEAHLVDVIWIPHGAYAARTIPRSKLAAVTDGEGHVLLVDLTRIDERWNAAGAIPADELFPTVKAILDDDVDSPDPRIVWRSPDPLASGTLAPIVDPDTGFVFAGKLLDKTTNAVSAIDPQIQIKADVGAASGLSTVGGVVPLGIEPPKNVVLNGPNASLGAFRFEVALPGAMDEAIPGGAFFLDVDSERVFGAKTEDTPAGWPRAHLKLKMERAVPASMTNLRFQRGYNKWISPWVVAIADPRASESWQWPNGISPAAEGCFSCARPESLRGKKEVDGVYELYSNGRLLRVHPNADFTNSPYAYLATNDRLTTRFATIMADTVRAPRVLVAAQSPAIAGGMLQETTYLHSGELESSSVDLVAEGRNGFDVVFDRTYRSRTIGYTALGMGWDSSNFRRLRALPTGDVEYRDGAGEVWRFKSNASGGYDAPKGLFLGLTSSDRGWQLVDQKGRITAFDNLGRMVLETDEFTSSAYAVDEGNIIRYLYGPDGLLTRIVDPVGRESTLTYDRDRLQSVQDKRGRVVTYAPDTFLRLHEVRLPNVANTDSVQPAIVYDYEPQGGTFNDKLELGSNLNAISDLKKGPRVNFTFGSGADRDKVKGQSWVTGESASFSYTAGSTSAIDALGQERKYTLNALPVDYNGDRTHVTQLDELAVETSTVAFGALPVAALAGVAPRAPVTRTFTFEHHDQGMVKTATLAGVRKTTFGYRPAGSAPGFVLEQTTSEPAVSPTARGVGTNASLGGA